MHLTLNRTAREVEPQCRSALSCLGFSTHLCHAPTTANWSFEETLELGRSQLDYGETGIPSTLNPQPARYAFAK